MLSILSRFKRLELKTFVSRPTVVADILKELQNYNRKLFLCPPQK